MADADRAMDGMLVQQFRESGDAPNALANLEAAIVQQAKPGGVVSAVFKAAQAIQKQWWSVLFTDISNDAAHELVISN
jgi:UTP-glucose-1-phosphate uridylyltransferase